VRNDTSPTNHNGGATLSLKQFHPDQPGWWICGQWQSATKLIAGHAQYCNGSRVPPENGGHGYLSPPGRSETTGLSPLFVFNNITPAATVDEGNNWITEHGPLACSTTRAVDGGRRVEPVIAGAYSIGAASIGQRGANSRCAVTGLLRDLEH